ncbi:MAG: hypothetical protein Ta2B_30100 [Termitinemataceae bacterium]|nr:MAG: hypothetical protein Ta2B_30100 [Termitinemataceae bacterium]
MKFALHISLIFFFCQSVFSQEVLRGEICVELEPVYAIDLGVSSPIDNSTAVRWALEDAQSAFSGMIYGWSFEYTPPNKARQIEESLDLTGLGLVQFGDEKMLVSDVRKENDLFFVWVDYQLNDMQKKRLTAWNSHAAFNANSQGYGALMGEAGITDRRDIKKGALEDAVKKAILAKLRLLYKNRPLRASGYISLSKFPIFRLKSGRWSCVASFRIEITGIENYSAF